MGGGDPGLTRHEFSRLLTDKLAGSPSLKALADWAHRLYLDRSKADGVTDALMTLIAMDEGPDFALDDEALRRFAVDLLAGPQDWGATHAPSEGTGSGLNQGGQPHTSPVLPPAPSASQLVLSLRRLADSRKCDTCRMLYPSSLSSALVD